jgi:Cytochrome c554 and c-prime
MFRIIFRNALQGRLIFRTAVFLVGLSITAQAEVIRHPSILGATSCSTSGCHGGAEEKSLQYTVWSQRDVHSRAYATLTTARSARMAEALGIKDATTSPSCVSCHAPFQAVKNVNPALLAADARVHDGVSCASCHGPGGDWVRSHTRKDFSHADKVAAGLKDLENLHARANSCVACHQNIDPELIAKGRHPRLIFELDGQTASQPRHWKEAAGYHGAQAWQVGQAVALREMSWALENGKAGAEEKARWRGLLWVLQRAPGDAELQSVMENNYEQARVAAERSAAAGAAAFDAAQAAVWLKTLASTTEAFADPSVERLEQAYRAERLVLALDRLVAATPSTKKSPEVSARLDVLFGQVQSIPAFAPDAFSRELTAFLKTLPQ